MWEAVCWEEGEKYWRQSISIFMGEDVVVVVGVLGAESKCLDGVRGGGGLSLGVCVA